MSAPFDDTEYNKLGYLYKKIAKGDPLAFPGFANKDASEAPGASSRINVFSSNIYSQPVLGSGADLDTIFSSMLVLDSNFNENMPNPANNNENNTRVQNKFIAGKSKIQSTDLGKKYSFPSDFPTVGATPHVKLYKYVTLKPISLGVSYRFNGTNLTVKNICTNAIPSNFDPVGSQYDIKVFNPSQDSWEDTPISSREYIFDCDSGILTFLVSQETFSDQGGAYPIITFCRYEGTFGVGSGSGSGTTTEGPTGAAGTNGVTGAQGVQGVQGVTGVKGEDGPTGAQGATGSQGVTGAQGVTGSQGVTGAEGAQGATGSQGATGAQGVTGVQGPPVVISVAPTVSIASTESPYVTVDSALNRLSFFLPIGSQGPTGASGTNGTNGHTGPQGNDGATGAQGATGDIGPTGSPGTPGSDATVTSETILSLINPLLTNYAKLDTSYNQIWTGNNNYQGINTFVTQDVSDNSTKAATTAFVTSKITEQISILENLPTQLATIEAAVQNLGLGATGSVIDQLANVYAPINNPTFTGLAKAPTPLDTTVDTQIANVKFVKDYVANNSSNVSGTGTDVLKNPPPAPLILDPSSGIVGTTSILFRFTPPGQEMWGFANFLIPQITTFKSAYRKGGTSTDTIVVNSSANTFVRVYPSTTASNANIVSGICFVNTNITNVYGTAINLTSTPSGAIYPITYNTDTRNYYVVKVDNSALFDTGNTLKVWYENFNTSYSNTGTFTFKMYVQASAPTIVNAYTPGTITATSGSTPFTTTNTTAFQAPVYWSKPDYSDSGNITQAVTVNYAKYIITYSIANDNIPKGYDWTTLNSSVIPSGTQTLETTLYNTTTPTSGSPFNITSLLPSTKYTSFIQAKNIQSTDLSPATTPSITFTTPDLAPKVTSITTTNNGTNIILSTGTWGSLAARDVNSSFVVRTIRTSAIDVTSDPISFPIHSTLTHMTNSLTTIQRTIGCSLIRGTSGQSGYESQTGPTAIYGGWGVSDPSSPAASNNLTITCSASFDQYSGVAGALGYYKQATATVKVGSGLMVSSNLQYTLSFTATDGTTPLTPITRTYYVEIPPSAVPTATLAYNLPVSLDTYFTTVNGIKIVKKDTNIPLTVDLTNIMNIGIYFSPDANFLQIKNGLNSPLLTEENIPTVGISTDANSVKTIKNSFDYSPAVNYTYSGVSGYQKSHSIECIINGLSGSSLAITSPLSAFSIIYDINTISYISALPTAIPTLDGTNKIVGFKVPSPIATSGDIAWYSSGTTPYRSASSNLSQELTLNNELLLSNGTFITPSTNLPGSEIGYASYGTTLGNTSLSYSSIVASSATTRFTTFAWAIPAATATTGDISYFFLDITFSSNTIISKSSNTEVILDGKTTISGVQALDIQYRIEDRLAPNPEPNISYLNTIWIAGNNTSDPRNPANSTNTNTIATTNKVHGQQAPPVISSNNVVTYKLIIPTIGSGSNQNVIVYTRIGLRNDVNARIESIKASF